MERQLPDFLIIAQPKSGSTSLMKTLGAIGAVSYEQQFDFGGLEQLSWTLPKRIQISIAKRFVNMVVPDMRLELRTDHRLTKLRDVLPALEFPAMTIAHSDIADFTYVAPMYKQLLFNSVLHKQHFPPTEGNISFFKPVPKVLLVRKVGKTIDSYMRLPRKTIFSELIHENPTFRESLAEELECWQAGWRETAKSQGFPVLEFTDLVEDTRATLFAAAAHFSFVTDQSQLDGIELARERMNTVLPRSTA